MIHLSQKTRSLSITRLEPITLPSFAVITGKNGSGKTHLLQGIKKGDVMAGSIQPDQIALFQGAAFGLSHDSAMSLQNINQRLEQVWQKNEQLIMPRAQGWEAFFDGHLPNCVKTANERGVPLREVAPAPFARCRQDAESIFSVELKKGRIDQQTCEELLELMQVIPELLTTIGRFEFAAYYKELESNQWAIPRSLSRAFFAYYTKQLTHLTLEFANKKYGSNKPYMPQDLFEKVHGSPPWELFQRLLSRFSTLPYEVISPEGFELIDSYKVQLRRTDNGAIVDFNNLSSGEKVLGGLVGLLYKSQSRRQVPPLLLLDEIDASLHPCMAERLIEVICEEIVPMGANVLMVTHSPTTVAVAPNESIYMLEKGEYHKLIKVSKSDAIRELTDGFVTLEQTIQFLQSASDCDLVILSEGKNCNYLRQLLELHSLSDRVEVVIDATARTGKDQLKTIFNFFSLVRPACKMLFVWDCDVGFVKRLEATSQVFPYRLPNNANNQLAKKGIENMFDEALMTDFTKTTSDSKGEILSKQFNEKKKNEFEEMILNRRSPEDYKRFDDLVSQIRRILRKEP